MKYKAVEDYADNGAFAGLSVIDTETGECVGIVEDPQSIAEDKERIKELEEENTKLKKVNEELNIQREANNRLTTELTKDLDKWEAVAKALYASHDGFGLSRIQAQLEKVGLIKVT